MFLSSQIIMNIWNLLLVSTVLIIVLKLADLQKTPKPEVTHIWYLICCLEL